MYESQPLKDHIDKNGTVKSRAVILAEWNLNIAENIAKIGNYRYRPVTNNKFEQRTIATSYDPADANNDYTGATDSDTTIDGGYNSETAEPLSFTLVDNRNKMLFSLEQCFDRFRPRSGVNKMIYDQTGFINEPTIDFANRPRYYMASRDDNFKYWTSVRKEESDMLGISFSKTIDSVTKNYINDACPFVVYKNTLPTNRVIVKLQTNVGTTGGKTYKSVFDSTSTYVDPFYGAENMTTPKEWEVQYLDDSNVWQTLKSFTSNIFGPDGYLELQYGLNSLLSYTDLVIAPQISSVEFLPDTAPDGYAFHLVQNTGEKGTHFVRKASNASGGTFDGISYPGWDVVPATYGWYVGSQTLDAKSSMVTNLTNPDSYVQDGQTMFREFTHINGLRLKVTSMNKKNAHLDLIEISPRLAADLTDVTTSYSTTREAADLGSTPLPVGQLIASSGSLEIFDYDMAFSNHNKRSILNVVKDDEIVYNISNKNIQIKFYEVVEQVGDYDYYVPIKTLYGDGFPETSYKERRTTISLKDMFFYFESMNAPELLIPDASVSYIVATLLDSVGFTNYKFYRLEDEQDDYIPYFFVAPETPLSTVLAQLAVATQTAMFFDEDNNFIVASRNYMFPSSGQRETSLVLKASPDQVKDGAWRNKHDTGADEILANVIDIASQSEDIYNAGKISYSPKYIQKTVRSIEQAGQLGKMRNWRYKTVPLWTVSDKDSRTSVNEEPENIGGYALTAIPLNQSITTDLPEVKLVNNVPTMVNNTFDFGDMAYFVGRYNGYFYANGEIIKFDAVQYHVTGYGDQWIDSSDKYADWFSKIPFNGKMFPTGKVRIYAEAPYDANDNLAIGPATKHGRGQFGTPVTYHSAGIDSSWTSIANRRGCQMSMDMLLNGGNIAGSYAIAGVTKDAVEYSSKASYSGSIKNFLVSGEIPESTSSAPDKVSTSVQASALVINGPSFDNSKNPVDYITYVHKNLDNAYTHFGTRTRIVGQTGSDESRLQTPIGSAGWTTIDGKTVAGSSGGMAVLINPETNVGYYFEIAALTDNNVTNYTGKDTPINNVYFYKLRAGSDLSVSDNITNAAIEVDSAGVTRLKSITNSLLVIPGATVGKKIALQYQANPLHNGLWEIEDLGAIDVPGNTPPIVGRRWSMKAVTNIARPETLWSGQTSIIADSGQYPGMGRPYAEENPTVFDLAVEYENIGTTRRFYLYINDIKIAIVDDVNPTPVFPNMALFARGSARLMFESVYALTSNYGHNTESLINAPINSVFTDGASVSKSKALNRYAISGAVQSTYLSGLGSGNPPKYNMYYEEFGTVMRECAYFNIKYEDAYPALRAMVSPTLNPLKGYTISGFSDTPYGAEFLLFNNTDAPLAFDEGSGNFLKIVGLTFTNQSSHDLTVDDYFSERGDLSSIDLISTTNLSKNKKVFQDVKNSRTTYGKKEFSLESPFIQSRDMATNLMEWTTRAIMKPRKAIGVNVFANPTIQLGDLVELDYIDKDGMDVAGTANSQFVVYSIEYQKDGSGPQMTMHLSEVY